jgi:hypothetical protein
VSSETGPEFQVIKARPNQQTWLKHLRHASRRRLRTMPAQCSAPMSILVPRCLTSILS